MQSTPDQQTKDVLAYLNAENDYRDTVMSHTKDFQEKLYNEIVGRIKQTDMSVPYKYNGYYYITRFEEGKDYAIKSRKKKSLEAPEEIIVDENERAKGQKYYAANGYNVSPNNQIIAIGEDLVSRDSIRSAFWTLLRQTTSRMRYPTPMAVQYGRLINSKTLFYEVKDEALRSFKIMRHTLGTSVASDQVVFHEKR